MSKCTCLSRKSGNDPKCEYHFNAYEYIQWKASCDFIKYDKLYLDLGRLHKKVNRDLEEVRKEIRYKSNLILRKFDKNE